MEIANGLYLKNIIDFLFFLSGLDVAFGIGDARLPHLLHLRCRIDNKLLV